jgi:hypothetical protein
VFCSEIFHYPRFTIKFAAQVERAFLCLLSVSGLQRVSLYTHLTALVGYVGPTDWGAAKLFEKGEGEKGRKGNSDVFPFLLFSPS